MDLLFGAPHRWEESDLMAALDRFIKSGKNPNTDATENYPTGKKDEIETEWDNTDKYVQGSLYIPDTTKQLVQSYNLSTNINKVCSLLHEIEVVFSIFTFTYTRVRIARA